MHEVKEEILFVGFQKRISSRLANDDAAPNRLGIRQELSKFKLLTRIERCVVGLVNHVARLLKLNREEEVRIKNTTQTQLFLEFLQQTQCVVAGDQRHMVVGADLL